MIVALGSLLRNAPGGLENFWVMDQFLLLEIPVFDLVTNCLNKFRCVVEASCQLQGKQLIGETDKSQRGLKNFKLYEWSFCRDV